MGEKLTPRQEKFFREYLIDRNGNQAAIRAGYSPKTACSMASTLLTNPKVLRKINEAIEKSNNEVLFRREKILKELEYIAFSRVPDLLEKKKDSTIKIKDFEKMTEAEKACLSEYQESYFEGEISNKKFKIHDKQKALELLLKHTELLEEKGRWKKDEESNSMSELANILSNAYSDRSENNEPT